MRAPAGPSDTDNFIKMKNIYFLYHFQNTVYVNLERRAGRIIYKITRLTVEHPVDRAILEQFTGRSDS